MRRLAIGLLMLAAATGAEAQGTATELPAGLKQTDAGEPPRLAPAGPLEVALLDRLAAIRAKAVERADTNWVDRLVAFYDERRGQPIWLDASGFSKRAKEAMAEIGDADSWGLSAKAFTLPAASDAAGSAADDVRAWAELRLSIAVLKYIEHARGGRLDPSTLSKWLDQSPKPVDPHAMLTGIAGAEDPAAYLRAMHPQHPQFEALRKAYLKLRPKPQAEAKAVQPIIIPSGPRLKPGDRHEHIRLVRERLGVPVGEGGADLFDAPLEAGLRSFLKDGGFRVINLIGPTVRAALNQPQQGQQQAPTGRGDLRRILINMERWRWLPDELGELHVWNNLPSFETRIVKAGKAIHQERIIIGKAETQTPVFSDRMRFVVFQPEWGVPNSIKVKQLLGKLQDGRYDVLDRRGMRISVAGKTVDPDRFDWDKVDIRRVPIVQEPGPENPLGQMKFMFPNKHDVYMHDTPAKGLFGSGTRMFSAGCIRVRNPGRFAELVFAEAGNLSKADISGHLAKGAKVNNRVDLQKPVSVHNVYFTLVANETGGFTSYEDIYGHDRRIGAVLLDGKPAWTIREQDPALRLEREVEEALGATAAQQQRKPAQAPVQVAARKSFQAPAFLGALLRN